MSQHAGLFFPEREWPVEEDILHAVGALPLFLSEVTCTHYCGWGFFFSIMNEHLYLLQKKIFKYNQQLLKNGHFLIVVAPLSYSVFTVNSVFGDPSHPPHRAVRTMVELRMRTSSCRQVVLQLLPIQCCSGQRSNLCFACSNQYCIYTAAKQLLHLCAVEKGE